MAQARGTAWIEAVSQYVLIHSHDPAECATAFAAWGGVASPLRGGIALAGCAHGDHRVFWTVSAGDPEAALAMLPDYVAERTVVARVRDVVIP